MGVTVIVNSMTVVHKSSIGTAPASAPDFCKTPAPPGPPVPVPYPNIARSSDAAKASKKVKCDGKPIMLKKSEFSRSMGDEAGTLKGVASNVNMGKAKFALYSFDVKVEGQNVPRLGDPMTNNGNASNTLTAKELQAAAVAMGVTIGEAKAICEAFCNAQKKYNDGEISGSGCCSREFQKQITQMRRQGRLPTASSEQSFFVPSGRGAAPQLLTPGRFNQLARGLQGSRAFNFVKNIAGRVGGTGAGGAGSVTQAAARRLSRAFNAVSKAGGRFAGRIVRPDLVLTRASGHRVIDAKFTWKNGKDALSPTQRRLYKKIDKDGKTRQVDGDICKC